MTKVFKQGRSNLSTTIFVPYDCQNNCKFCTSKVMYKHLKSNKDGILNSIKQINDLDINEIVFTGGEPFANIRILDELIQQTANQKIYINTTLPILYPEAEVDIINYINNSTKISGINISRHGNSFKEDIALFNPNIMSDKDIAKIKKPIRINCVISETTDIQAVLNRWSKHKNVTIVFRADYTKITLSNLRSLDDEFSSLLMEHATYLSHGGCDVCFDIIYDYNNKEVHYHKGLEKSSVNIGNIVLVNDIIIKQDGSMYYDWDNKNDEIKNMLLAFKSKMCPNMSTKAIETVDNELKKANRVKGYTNAEPVKTNSSSCGISSGFFGMSSGACGTQNHSYSRLTSACGRVFGTCG